MQLGLQVGLGVIGAMRDYGRYEGYRYCWGCGYDGIMGAMRVTVTVGVAVMMNEQL